MKYDRVEMTFIYFDLMSRNHYVMKEGRKSECPEETANNKLQKIPHTKVCTVQGASKTQTCPLALVGALARKGDSTPYVALLGVSLTFEKLPIANAQHGKNCVSSLAAKTTISTDLPKICHDRAGLQTAHRPF